MWPAPVTLSRIDVLTLDAPGQPASVNGLRDYDVQVLVDGAWTSVASVRGNTAGTIESTFPPVRTSALRLLITDSNDHGYSRVVELEGYPS
jgi:alpha-L-rhamnosidase